MTSKEFIVQSIVTTKYFGVIKKVHWEITSLSTTGYQRYKKNTNSDRRKYRSFWGVHKVDCCIIRVSIVFFESS